MTTESMEDLRKRLSLGEHIGHVTVLNHPESGDAFACVTMPGHKILWAYGPIHWTDKPQDVIDNQFSGEMEDDADWLMSELDRCDAWGATE